MRILDPETESRDEFTAVIFSALELLQQTDSMRFDRVRREIRMVVQMPAAHCAQYSRPMRVCTIDFRKLHVAFDITREYGIQFLACVLIHEATHGSLFSRRIVQTRRNYARVERLCCLEMLRFAQKVGMDEITCRILSELGENAKPDSLLACLKSVREILSGFR